jgi:parallel beta-helix repeat protein
MITKFALGLAALVLIGIEAISPAAYADGFITSCGRIIIAGSTGTWTVTGNLTALPGQNCIKIKASTVAIDLASHTITGTGTTGYGITDGGTPSNIIVANGNINGFQIGIHLTHTVSATIAKMSVTGNVVGILLDQGPATVTDSIVSNNAAQGMYFLGSNNTVNNSQASSNGDFGMLFAGSNNIVNNSQASSNGDFGMFFASSNNGVYNTQANLNGGSGMYFVGSVNTLYGNIADKNGLLNKVPGIVLTCPSTLLDNTAAGNFVDLVATVPPGALPCNRSGNTPPP